MTGLPYQLLALNLVGSVFPHQLGDRLAVVPEPAVIKRMVVGDVTAFHQHPHIKRGLPFGMPNTYRWKAHELALRDLHWVQGPLPRAGRPIKPATLKPGPAAWSHR